MFVTARRQQWLEVFRDLIVSHWCLRVSQAGKWGGTKESPPQTRAAPGMRFIVQMSTGFVTQSLWPSGKPRSGIGSVFTLLEPLPPAGWAALGKSVTCLKLSHSSVFRAEVLQSTGVFLTGGPCSPGLSLDLLIST